jgi:hypothetical protein
MEVSFSLNGGATQANLMTMALKRGEWMSFIWMKLGVHSFQNVKMFHSSIEGQKFCFIQ